jgi:hypothetical protein
MSELRDLKNNLASDALDFKEILGDGATNSSILDTAHYDSGIMFSFACPDYGDGTYSFALYESDDSGMSGKTLVPADQIIGSLSTIIFTSQTSIGDKLSSIGVIGSKRYLQMEVTASGVTTGATIVVVANKVPEYLPVV